MKKFCSSVLTILVLSACSSTRTPTPNKLAQDIQAIPPQTVLSLVAQQDLAPPTDAQSIVKLTTFSADDNLYDKEGNKLIIPRGALVVGLYSNDGIKCSIEWKAMYLNQKELAAGRGTLALNKVTMPSSCDPVTGFKHGQRVIMNFTQNFDNYSFPISD